MPKFHYIVPINPLRMTIIAFPSLHELGQANILRKPLHHSPEPILPSDPYLNDTIVLTQGESQGVAISSASEDNGFTSHDDSLGMDSATVDGRTQTPTADQQTFKSPGPGIIRATTAILKPLCAIPGIGLSRYCQLDISDTVTARKNSKTIWADFPHLMEAQTFTFDALLDNSVGGSGLSLEIKKAEMATADLSTLVEFSQLENREVLGGGLRLLSSQITGAMDLIIAVNGYAMRTLSSISSSRLSRAIAPFTSQPSTSDIILCAFVDSLNTLTTLVEDLILLAEVEILDIERLKEQLSLVHMLVVCEGSAILSAKAELLGDIWTMLGGNRRTLQGYDKNLDLLRGIGGVRKQALAHVVLALHLLMNLRYDMEVMRANVSRPGLTGPQILIEAHVESIQLGIEGLKSSRALARAKEEDVNNKVFVGDQGIILVTAVPGHLL